MTEVITPANEAAWLELRKQDLTSTDAAALFNLSPYCTYFELWWRKKSGKVPTFTVSDRMTWGNRLEAVVAEGIAHDRSWTIRPMKDYMRLPEHRLGSSFDYRIIQIADIPCVNDGILEIKTVDLRQFKDSWQFEGDDLVAPAHIEIQVQHQMLVSGLKYAYIGCLIGGNEVKLLRRDADPAVHAAIIKRAATFWASISSNVEPSPTMPGDAAMVISLNQFAEPGKSVIRDDLATVCEEYAKLGKQIKTLDESREVLKSRLLSEIGSAERCKAGGYSISAGVVGEAEIAYTRAAYRNLRVTSPKGNK